MVSDFVFATAVYKSGDWESAQLLPANLIDSIAKYTALPVAPKGVNVDLGTEEIFQYPFVWFTGHLPVRFTDQERKNLKHYVERGGFMVIDDHNHDIDGIFQRTVQEELTRIFGRAPKTADSSAPVVASSGTGRRGNAKAAVADTTGAGNTPQGLDKAMRKQEEKALSPALQRLPNNHELYHCFFKFGYGPPATSQEVNGWGDQLVHKSLYAVMQGTRIGLLYSQKDYSSEWNFHPDTKQFLQVDPTRFGINMIVYALTR
jgi:hypothetical protein